MTDTSGAVATSDLAHDLSGELRIAVGRLSRRIRAEKADGELSDGQFSVLALLYREGPRTVGALAELERVTPPSMNRRIGYLLEHGLVTKQADAEDGRRVIVAVTPEGERFVLETRRLREEWLHRRVSTLPADAQQLLRAAAAVMKELADS